jgi:two-component system nitrate/nitrite response regulator NarL
MDSGGASITVMIAVDVRLYREGLATGLGAESHLEVVSVVGTGPEARAAARMFHPRIAIVDVSLEDVLAVMRDIRHECIDTRILAFAVREELSVILNYAEAGADGFVAANASMRELVEAIERTAAGELLCSPRMAAQLLHRAAHRPRDPATVTMEEALTVREQQILALLRQGRSNKEIARSLRIAEATVKNHVHHLLGKLKVTTRAQAVARR